MSKDCLRTGDKALIHFRFIKHPEYIVPGQRMVFREGRTKAVGNVVRIITHSTPLAQGGRAKPSKQQRMGSQNSPKITAPHSVPANQNLQEVCVVNYNPFIRIWLDYAILIHSISHHILICQCLFIKYSFTF